MSVDALTWLVRGTYDIGQLPGLGPRSVALAGLLSIAASLVFGLGPALYASRSSVQAAGIASQSAARSVAGSPGRKPRLALVAAQFALSVTLLVAAGLLLRTFVHLRNLEPGFDPNHLVAASVSLEDARYRSVDRVMRLADEGLARLAQSPGVDSAALSLGVPYERLLNLGFRFADAGSAGADARGEMTSATYVTPGFFETMKIPVRRGRTFDARDSSTASPAVVVNEAFARTYLRGAEIIGRRIRLAGAERQIIGVVGDVQVKPGWGEHGPLAAMPLTYLPLTQVNDGLARLVHGWFLPTFVVRSSLPPAQTAASLRQALASVDPLLPLATIRTMFEIRAAALSSQRLLMTLLLALALATVVVAAIGIHGLIASSVTERTREMGIRVALGATSADALRALAMPGVALAAISTVLGLLCAMVVVRFLRHFVWGISINDPVTFACVGLFLLSVGTVASVVPALRILRLDPAITLRGEL
jgi:predicted permease